MQRATPVKAIKTARRPPIWKVSLAFGFMAITAEVLELGSEILVRN